MTADDLGHPLATTAPARRVVSLVPSLTEAIARSRPEAIIGATQWCTHPVDLDVPRVRGTKNPDVRAIVDLVPDLVIANQEENRELDVRRLRQAGVPVWVTVTRDVPSAIASLERLFDQALRWPRPLWLAYARQLWCRPPPPVRARVAVAIWREPWMFVGSSTFTGDVVRRLGWQNVLMAHPERYPTLDPGAVDQPSTHAVLLPDEPYAFHEDDGPEAFRFAQPHLVSGRLLTWYGPSLVEAWRTLSPIDLASAESDEPGGRTTGV